MNIHSYTILHYGKDYLSYALRSVYDYVDQLHVVYTPHPSHGHKSNAQAPDSREELMRVAFDYNPDDKIRWYDVNHIWDEGKHRDFALQACRLSDAGNNKLILVLDYDEIWHSETLTKALNHAWDSNAARDWLINFTHFWRSFNWVCRDNNWPVRIIDLRHNEGVGYISQEYGDIYHFGYAVTTEMMEYKWKIHGHKSEMRDGWWAKWNEGIKATDCHPTNDNNWWVPELFYKQALPELMKSHPFYDKELIE